MSLYAIILAYQVFCTGQWTAFLDCRAFFLNAKTVPGMLCLFSAISMLCSFPIPYYAVYWAWLLACYFPFMLSRFPGFIFSTEKHCWQVMPGRLRYYPQIILAARLSFIGIEFRSLSSKISFQSLWRRRRRWIEFDKILINWIMSVVSGPFAISHVNS